MQRIIERILNDPYLILGIVSIIAILITSFVFSLMNKKPEKKELVYEDDLDDTPLEKEEEPIEKTLKPIVELTDEQKEARLELEKVIEQMEEDLSGKQEENIVSFEQEQEEKAIISYQELLRTAGKATDIPKKEPDVEITNIINSLVEEEVDDAFAMNTIDINEPVKEKVVETPKEPFVMPKQEKFRSSEFVSPVYGRQQSDVDYPTIPNKETLEKRIKNEVILELEKTLNTKCSDLEKNDAFLQALKDFRKNLE